MTQILCQLDDSAGNPLSGFIRVLVQDVLSTNTIQYVPVAADVQLVNGQCTLDLQESGLTNISYLFQVYKSGNPAELVYEFISHVPASLTPIRLQDLLPSGINRYNFNGAVSTVGRRLYNDPDFWDAARANLFRVRGDYSPTGFYRNGDLVFWQGGQYLCKATVNIQGILPTDTNNWQQWSSRGETGGGTTGENQPYDPVGWDNVLAAPSKNAVRDIIETLATKAENQQKANINGATLTNASVNVNFLQSDYSGRIPSTAWVRDWVNFLQQALCPVGMVADFVYLSSPAGWLPCDGRLLLIANYPTLAGLIGTAYNNAGDPANQFRLPDLRGRARVGPDSLGTTGAAGRLTTNNTIGANGGAATHALTIAEMPAHNHTGTNVWATAGAGSLFASASGGASNTAAVNTQGSGQAHNNMQPYQILVPHIYTGVVI